jgi:hypothetical protein
MNPRHPKKEVRVLGIDDGPFDKSRDKDVLLVGVVYRGGQFMDGILSTHARVDGDDATDVIARLVNKSKFKPQLRALFLHGIAVGGFNIIDLPALHRRTRLPVIVVVRDYPNFEDIYAALRKLGQERKIGLIEQLPKPVQAGRIWMQAVGISRVSAERLVKVTSTRSEIPEPLRAAHIIAAGIMKGESRGRA